ncbi:MAG: archaellin/type IV pilin N-terminal domain-containing protein, partial [Candidatus Heimdallarchaeaceae archaeon]
MKKRGVSPVIATVLLIALVTAAAAIVFLVV